MVKSTHNTNEKTNGLATTRTILRKQRNRRLNITIILTTLLHKDHVQATQTKFRGPLQSMHVHNDDDRMPFVGEVYRMKWSPTFFNTYPTPSPSSSLNEAHRYTNGLEGLDLEHAKKWLVIDLSSCEPNVCKRKSKSKSNGWPCLMHDGVL